MTSGLPPREPALTVKDVAEHFNVSPRAVYNWIEARKIGFLRLPGGSYRFRRKHIDEFEASLCPAPSSTDPTTVLPPEKAPSSGTSRGMNVADLDFFRHGQRTAARQRDV
jgi:excisionase family DNA binding protein